MRASRRNRSRLSGASAIGAKDLYRHEPLERPVAREIDRAHATVAEGPNDLVLRAEGTLDGGAQAAVAFGHEGCSRAAATAARAAGDAVGSIGGGEQRVDLAAKLAIRAATRWREIARGRRPDSRARRPRRLDLGPAFRRHEVPSSRRNHARATAHRA